MLANAAWFCLIAGVGLSILGFLTISKLLDIMLPVPEAHGIALSYSRWRLLGVVSMGMTMALKAFFDGIGKTWVHLVSALVMNVFNVLFCFLFIFGKRDAPHQGHGRARRGLRGVHRHVDRPRHHDASTPRASERSTSPYGGRTSRAR